MSAYPGWLSTVGLVAFAGGRVVRRSSPIGPPESYQLAQRRHSAGSRLGDDLSHPRHHSRASGNPILGEVAGCAERAGWKWIPASAGMTPRVGEENGESKLHPLARLRSSCIACHNKRHWRGSVSGAGSPQLVRQSLANAIRVFEPGRSRNAPLSHLGRMRGQLRLCHCRLGLVRWRLLQQPPSPPVTLDPEVDQSRHRPSTPVSSRSGIRRPGCPDLLRTSRSSRPRDDEGMSRG